MTRLHLYAIALCVLASPAAIAQGSDANSGYGTGESVTRDRYSDKFMTRPGAAQVTGRSGGRLPSQRSNNARLTASRIQAPQVPPRHGPGHPVSASPGVQGGPEEAVARNRNGSTQALTPSADRTPAVADAYSRGYHEPLINGLRALMPDHCVLEVQDGIQDTEVSWESNGRPWDQALRQMVSSAGLYQSIVYTPCRVAVATSPGTAQRMAGGSSSIPDGPDPYRADGATPERDADSGAPDASEEPNTGLTYQEYLADYVTADLRSASLQEVFETVTPLGWDVRLEIEDESLLTDTYDITAETTRGQIIGSLEQQLRLKAEPYVDNRILVVSEQ